MEAAKDSCMTMESWCADNNGAGWQRGSQRIVVRRWQRTVLMTTALVERWPKDDSSGSAAIGG